MLLFMKAKVPGGAMGDLFAAPVQVQGYTRGATFVAPHTAVRHKAPDPTPAPPREGWRDIGDFVEATLRGEEADPAAAAREMHVSPENPLAPHAVLRLRSFLEGKTSAATIRRIAAALPPNPSLLAWAGVVRAEVARKPQADPTARAAAATQRAADAGDNEARRLIEIAARARATRDRARTDYAEARAFWKNDTGARRQIGGLSLSAQRMAGAQRDYQAATRAVTAADAAVAAYRPAPEPAPAPAAPEGALSPELRAAYLARREAREGYTSGSYRSLFRVEDEARRGDAGAQRLLDANAAVATQEIAERPLKPSTAASIRALYGVPESWTIHETFTAGEKRPRAMFPDNDHQITIRFAAGQAMGQAYYRQYDMRGGTYWSAIGKPHPIAETIAKHIERQAETQRRMEESRAYYAAQQAEEAAAAQARETALAQPITAAELGPAPIQSGTYGAFTIYPGRHGAQATPGYYVAFDYSAKRVAAIKQITGRKWDADEKRWWVPADQAPALRTATGAPAAS